MYVTRNPVTETTQTRSAIINIQSIEDFFLLLFSYIQNANNYAINNNAIKCTLICKATVAEISNYIEIL